MYIRQAGTQLFWFSLGILLLVVPAMGRPKAAAVELHNISGEFLPRIDSYSEDALNSYFARSRSIQFVGRTAVSEMIIRRRDRVVLFPDNPVLAASFGRDLGVDYIVTGNILDYSSDDVVHRMMVEFLVISVEEEDYILRKVYDAEYREATRYKKHREILDQMIENMALDFEVHFGDAEERRVRRAEERRQQAERLARARAQAEAEARALEKKMADARLRRVEAAADEAEARARLAEAEARLGQEKFNRFLQAKQNHYGVKSEKQADGSWVVIRVQEVKLLEPNWGPGDADFQLAMMAHKESGNANAYLFPSEGTVPLALGHPLSVSNMGFSLKLSEADGKVPVYLTGIDRDDTSSKAFSLSLEGVLQAVAAGTTAIAKSRGMRSGKAYLFGKAIELAGSQIIKFIEKNDVIGAAEVHLDHRGGGLADGKTHTILSPDGAISFVFDVLVDPGGS